MLFVSVPLPLIDQLYSLGKSCEILLIEPSLGPFDHGVSDLFLLHAPELIQSQPFGAVWYIILNTCFQFLKNITCISTHFFTHTYFQKN